MLLVELTAPARDGGAVVRLTSQWPGVVRTPATVTVPKGRTRLMFTVATVTVAEPVKDRVGAAFGGSASGYEVRVAETELRAIYGPGLVDGVGQGRSPSA